MNNVSSSKYIFSFHMLLYVLHSLIVAAGFSVIYCLLLFCYVFVFIMQDN